MDLPRFRLDDLRRFATALGTAAGIPRARAAELASHLLWFDAAGQGRFGVATLPSWLGRLEAGAVDPSAEGEVAGERTSLAVLDGRNGLAPLVLARASGIAIEKARDSGVGLVRVANLAPGGPSAATAAEMAVGPYAAAILGPGPSWSWAFPSAEGLPAVFDSAFVPEPEPAADTEEAPKPARSSRSRRAATPSPPPAPAPAPPPPVPAWISALAPEGGWLVAAIAVAALESLASFHERLAATLGGATGRPGALLPGPWEEQRRLARERGVPLDRGAAEALGGWAARLSVEGLDAAEARRPGT